MANEHVEQTIAEFMADVRRLETEVADTKRIVNKLAAKIGRPPVYAETEPAASASIASIRRDQWYGQPISAAIREYLTMRRNANMGPATVSEIYDALTSGGFAFGAQDAENAKRGIRICLTKNSSMFHRLPDQKTYGLLEWYPEAKAKKAKEPITPPVEEAEYQETEQTETPAGPEAQ